MRKHKFVKPRVGFNKGIPLKNVYQVANFQALSTTDRCISCSHVRMFHRELTAYDATSPNLGYAECSAFTTKNIDVCNCQSFVPWWIHLWLHEISKPITNLSGVDK